MGILVKTIFSGPKPLVGVDGGQAATKTLVNLVKNFSGILQNSFLVVYGTKEILFDRVRDISKTKNHVIITHATRINHYLNKIFVKKDPFIGPLRFNNAHGLLYIGSGLTGSAAALHKLGWINLGGFGLPLEIAGNCLFSLACLTALIHNVKIYRAAAKVTPHAPLYKRQAAHMLKVSSVLGIISSLNYIVAASLLVMGPLASLALVFGCIAVLTGCMKILYDFLKFRNAR